MNRWPYQGGTPPHTPLDHPRYRLPIEHMLAHRRVTDAHMCRLPNRRVIVGKNPDGGTYVQMRNLDQERHTIRVTEFTLSPEAADRLAMMLMVSAQKPRSPVTDGPA